MHDDCAGCFDQQPEILNSGLLQNPLIPLDHNEVRFPELR